MSKLPHWMQGILFFCTITGLVFWVVVIVNAVSADKPVKYDCSLSSFHPDFPAKVREQCRQAMRVSS